MYSFTQSIILGLGEGIVSHDLMTYSVGVTPRAAVSRDKKGEYNASVEEIAVQAVFKTRVPPSRFQVVRQQNIAFCEAIDLFK